MRIPTLSNSQSSQEPALCAVVMRREKGRFVYITSSETGKKDDRFFKEAIDWSSCSTSHLLNTTWSSLISGCKLG
jgi:hypothetical protein